MSASEVLLAFEDAVVGYGGRPVLSRVTLAVGAGEVVGLVGPNGAGKSTLLRAVTGAARLEAGLLAICGQAASGLSARARAKMVAVVPQALPVPFAMSARRFVELGRHPHLDVLERPGPADAAVVEDAMRRTDTLRLADQTVDTLSGGDLQRLTVAQALAQQPKVLLLDEATAHLDVNHALQVLDLVRREADAGAAVLAVFHDLDLAARYADRIAIVAEGAVSEPAPPEVALDAATLSRVFDVRAVVRVEPVTGAVAVVPIVRGAEVAALRRGPVGLVCGSGAGARLQREFARAGCRVVCGALNEGDVDASVAEALGHEFLRLPPFGEAGAEAEAWVEERFAACAAVAVAPTPFGRANVANLRAAVRCGAPLVLLGDLPLERDYTGGEAQALARAAVERGALVVPNEDEVVAAVLAHLEAKEAHRG
ncbi:ABC transporter ATP-binding protein [Coriobacteriia bacterium Es71-Z0120]|uniref:ABC transporter ATP-binding protein n=1 Tax=Parvivirga hydrogeniphila TaxID=2939460 RepID=UPI002260B8E3|nr:ABC transporter ATP-binding protein [Parvivirga hydrogeniphila]MCL4079443.1 ABC transporter ATP-binding protein [Parvivirga hydrogeniphila]